MPKIFISYRREDSQWPADKLYAAIKPLMADPEHDVFIDVDNIPLGVNFAQHIESRVSQCDVMLALIGRDWIDARSPQTGARRLDDPKDFVRIEIASALKRGVAVVPVLLDGAQVPAAADLPDDLQELSLRNGVEVRRLSFEADAVYLFRKLGLLGATENLATAVHARAATPHPIKGRGLATVAIALTALAAVGIAAWLWFADQDKGQSPTSSSTAASPPVAPPAAPGVALSDEVNDALKTLDATRISGLIERGWNPNSSIDSESNTALHILMGVCEKNPGHDAAQLARVATVLIASGANKTARNKWGDTPLSIARSPKYCGPNHPVIAELQ